MACTKEIAMASAEDDENCDKIYQCDKCNYNTLYAIIAARLSIVCAEFLSYLRYLRASPDADGEE